MSLCVFPQVRVELQAQQQEALRQKSEGERQMRLAEQDRTELREEAQGVREQVEEAARERDRLEEQCRNLEARRTHADRCLEAAEDGARVAEAELNRLHAELGLLRQEQRQAHTHRSESLKLHFFYYCIYCLSFSRRYVLCLCLMICFNVCTRAGSKISLQG